MLLIFDEAEGIGAEFWEAAESFADRWVCFYNPTEANSQAAIEETRKRWTTIRMSALNHPNVKLGEKGFPPCIPNAVTLDKVLHRLDKWAVKLDPGTEFIDPREVTVNGDRYLPGPIAEARILGRRPSKPINAVFARLDIERMLEVRHAIKPHAAVQLGCDVARFGDDFSVMIARKGMTAIHHEAHNGWDTRQTAERLRVLAQRFAPSPSDAMTIPILVDDTGVGGGVVDQSGGYNFIGVNASTKSHKPEEYPDIRSEIAFDFEDLVREGLIDISLLSPSAVHDITEQMRALCYTMGVGARRKVAPKKDMKAALGRSPDDLDALLLAFYMYPETFETK